jgi:hypothetical protein
VRYVGWTTDPKRRLYGASEMRWVAHFKSDKLTNLTDGGDGTLGRVNSPEHRAKISAARKAHKTTPEAWASDP